MDFSNLVVAFEAVVPMFVLMLVGIMIRRARLLTDTELRHVNSMVFKVFFSVMLFHGVYTTNIGTMFRPRLIIFALVALAVVYVSCFVIVCWREKSSKRRGAMIQAIYRSNFVLMGIPLIANMFGDDNIAVTTMMVAIIVPIYNVLGVVTLETFRGGRVNVAHILIDVLKNPMIVGALVGVFFLLTGIHLPKPVMRPLAQIAACTSTLALIILGASFQLGSTRDHIPQLVAVVLSRIVIVPGLVLGAAAMMGFRGIEFATLLSIFASPCAVASFVMAQQMDSDAALAGNCVVFSTALSCLTLFGWIVLYKELGVM